MHVVFHAVIHTSAQTHTHTHSMLSTVTLFPGDGIWLCRLFSLKLCFFYITFQFPFSVGMCPLYSTAVCEPHCNNHRLL